jgi:hypothetical protein
LLSSELPVWREKGQCGVVLLKTISLHKRRGNRFAKTQSAIKPRKFDFTSWRHDYSGTVTEA